MTLDSSKKVVHCITGMYDIRSTKHISLTNKPYNDPEAGQYRVAQEASQAKMHIFGVIKLYSIIFIGSPSQSTPLMDRYFL